MHTNLLYSILFILWFSQYTLDYILKSIPDNKNDKSMIKCFSWWILFQVLIIKYSLTHTYTLVYRHKIYLVHTVWHTWNLILRFYGWWQNRKIKIHKLYANLVYTITRSRKKLGFHKIKIPTTFCPNDSKANRKI